jgi:phosphotransferase family enzyme
MPPWTDPDWLREAHAWIRDRLDAAGTSITGPIEQPHVRPWATALRVPTVVGDVWFKASVPVLAFEAAVVAVLARTRPDRVPPLLAVDPDRGWMLMGDGGVRLRELVEQDGDLRRWLDVLPLYAELQMDLAGSADELVACGAPDRRLDTLAAQYEQLIGELDVLSGSERDRLLGLGPEVAEMCRRLAGVGVPETIQHDDLHDGQVFVRDRSYLFFDWGDACVSHPFFSMSVTLEGVLAWGLDDVEGSVEVTPFRDAYLEPFARHADRAALEDAHATALRLGWICRALTSHRLAVVLESPQREEHLAGVRTRLLMFLAGLPPERA